MAECRNFISGCSYAVEDVYEHSHKSRFVWLNLVILTKLYFISTYRTLYGLVTRFSLMLWSQINSLKVET